MNPRSSTSSLPFSATLLIAATLLALGLLAACDDDASPGLDAGPDADAGTDTGADAGADVAPGPLAIVGTYVDDFGTVHRISEATYVNGWEPDETVVAITRWDNDAGWLVGQNASDHPWNPDQWSRFEWSQGDGVLYVCQSVFAADTEADALAAPAADADDPTAGGCGGFPWSALGEGQGSFALSGGSFVSEWAFMLVRDDGLYDGWAPADRTHTLERYDNAAQYLVAQNAPDDDFNPDKWSRFDWTWGEDGTLYWCQSAFGADTADDAEGVETADRTDPATSGCGGSFPWSAFSADQGPIALAGVWESADAVIYDLSDESGAWTVGADAFALASYDNGAGYAIAQNGSENETDPELWSRFDWTWDDTGALYLCHTTGDAVDAEAAEAEAAPNRTDPADDGCGDGPWTALTEGT